VQAVIKRLANQARAKNIELSADLPTDLPSVQADPDRITQVLTNLVDNAVQYTPESGKVTVSAACHEEDVQIIVSDSGIGIPSEHFPHLFTRFYRVDKSRSRQSGGGSGIGLTIAKYLVEAQGGRIWAESAGAGKGSRFNFTLKVAQAK
jgi:histidine kinase